MPHIPIPNGIRVCLNYTNAGELACNVFHVEGPSDPTLADLTTIAEEFVAWWNANMKPLTSAATSLQSVEVTDVTADGQEGIEYTTGLPLAGTASGANLPNNVTVATKLTSGLTGRSRRGRSYFVGLTDNALNTGSQTLTTTFQAALTGAFQELIEQLVVAGFQLAVASLWSNGVPRTTGLLTPIINAEVNPTVDSQRRRLPERGA